MTTQITAKINRESYKYGTPVIAVPVELLKQTRKGGDSFSISDEAVIERIKASGFDHFQSDYVREDGTLERRPNGRVLPAFYFIITGL